MYNHFINITKKLDKNLPSTVCNTSDIDAVTNI